MQENKYMIYLTSQYIHITNIGVNNYVIAISVKLQLNSTFGEYKWNILCWILGNHIVDKTNQPEDEDKEEEKDRIEHSHEGLAEINFTVSLILAPCLGLGDRSRS